MLDIHCHILPNIDDGAKTVQASLEMLKIAQEDGTDKIIVSPHYSRGYYENTFDDIAKSVENLNKLAAQNSVSIKMYPGQEIYLDNKTVDLYKNGIIRGLNYTKYLLVEFPMNKYDETMLDILYELRIKGAEPIIAHPERYVYFIENPSLINQFVKEGYLFQINTGSIKGIFGKHVKGAADIFIKNNICDFLGSDAHTVNQRCPGLSDSLKYVRNKNRDLEKRIISNMDKLYDNMDISAAGEAITNKKKFFKWF